MQTNPSAHHSRALNSRKIWSTSGGSMWYQGALWLQSVALIHCQRRVPSYIARQKDTVGGLHTTLGLQRDERVNLTRSTVAENWDVMRTGGNCDDWALQIWSHYQQNKRTIAVRYA